MKKIFKLLPFLGLGVALVSCSGEQSKPAKDSDNGAVKTTLEAPAQVAAITAGANGKVQHLTTEEFVKGVYDFRTQTTFALNSELPCVVDFYADWCKPCKMIAPYIEELAGEYKGKVNFLKINVDEESEIANFYQIQAIPTLLFLPKKGNPKMETGGADKATIKQKVEVHLLGR